MAAPKKSPLAKVARKFAASRSEKELRRLVGRRGSFEGKRLSGRRLRASNAWRRWEIELLGRCKDAEAARQLGRSVRSIIRRRLQLHIGIFEPEQRPWKHEHELLLGTMPDAALASRLCRTVKALSWQP